VEFAKKRKGFPMNNKCATKGITEKASGPHLQHSGGTVWIT
jgi:hypothetical protein